MELLSVESPKPSPFESAETAELVQPRLISEASVGSEPDELSLAEGYFLVQGVREEPLVPRTVSSFESILGSVDRRKRVLETKLTPWRMLCALQIDGPFGTLVGTGFLVGPRTLITAGHCVFDPVGLGGWARKITITPGKNGAGGAPFGKVVSKVFSTTNLWQQKQDPDFDYAAIHLGADLGAQLGFFALGVLPDAELRNRLVNVSGYPSQPGAGQEQYFHANRVNGVTARRVFYDVDTVGGQSGSPVWAYLEDSPQKPVVIGVHAYGIGGVPSGLNVRANSGPRVIPESFALIQSWIEKDKQT